MYPYSLRGIHSNIDTHLVTLFQCQQPLDLECVISQMTKNKGCERSLKINIHLLINIREVPL